MALEAAGLRSRDTVGGITGKTDRLLYEVHRVVDHLVSAVVDLHQLLEGHRRAVLQLHAEQRRSADQIITMFQLGIFLRALRPALTVLCPA